jgi:hypothetical protein
VCVCVSVGGRVNIYQASRPEVRMAIHLLAILCLPLGAYVCVCVWARVSLCVCACVRPRLWVTRKVRLSHTPEPSETHAGAFMATTGGLADIGSHAGAV